MAKINQSDFLKNQKTKKGKLSGYMIDITVKHALDKSIENLEKNIGIKEKVEESAKK